ncbi:Coenzyme Q-binding protein coq10, mitochondrial [Elasticomyces elasticus]
MILCGRHKVGPLININFHMADYLSAALGAPAHRRLTHTKTLPYHPSTVFSAITNIQVYSDFLSLVHSSSVTVKDAHGLPKGAKLKVGYPRFGIEENWACRVTSDKKNGVVKIARGGDGDKASDGVLEEWSVHWKLSPPPGPNAASKTTEVELIVEVKFRNPIYDQAFALLPNVAQRMLLKFENRSEQLDQAERKERVAKMKEKAKLAAAQKETSKAGDAKETVNSTPKTAPKKLEVRGSKPTIASELVALRAKKAAA